MRLGPIVLGSVKTPTERQALPQRSYNRRQDKPREDLTLQVSGRAQ